MECVGIIDTELGVEHLSRCDQAAKFSVTLAQ